MLANRALPLVVAGVSSLCGYACEDNGVRTSIGPSHLRIEAGFVSRAVSIEPRVLRAPSIHDLACSTRQQFTLPFELFVRSDGGSALSLREVRVQVLDRRRTRRFGSIFGGPRLIGLFGSTVVPPFATRGFPFAVPVDCDFIDGRLTVVVFAVDAFGEEHHMSTAVDVLP